MGEMAKALGDSDLERIGAYVKGNLYGWFVEVAPHLVNGPQILERTATIEQELRNQRELMAVRFDAMDRRFEEMGKRSDERFKEMGKRSDERFAAVNVRFEDMNKRFGSIQWLIGGLFVVLGVMMSVFEFIT